MEVDWQAKQANILAIGNHNGVIIHSSMAHLANNSINSSKIISLGK